MPNGGVGGAGAPIGGSFTGAAELLEIVGDFAFAYSGAVAVDNVETTLLEFQSGNFIFVGAFQHMYIADSADNYRWFVYLNETLVAVAASGSLIETGRDEVELVIPPYTQVKISAQNFADTSSNDMGAVMTGRVYR